MIQGWLLELFPCKFLQDKNIDLQIECLLDSKTLQDTGLEEEKLRLRLNNSILLDKLNTHESLLFLFLRYKFLLNKDDELQILCLSDNNTLQDKALEDY